MRFTPTTKLSANFKQWSLPSWQVNWEPNQIRAMRMALGVTLALAVALAGNWPMSFLLPVLTTSFMKSSGPCISLRQGGMILGGIVAAGMVGLMLSIFFIDYPVVCMLLIGVLLMNIFYLNTSGFSPFLIVLLLICVTTIPILGQQSNALAVGFGLFFMVAAILAMLINWLMHGLLPDSPKTVLSMAAKEVAAPPKKLADDERLNSALTSTFVVLPIVLLFFSLELSNAALIMIFVVILAQNPDLQTGFKGCVAMILGNTVGGVVAIVMYNLIMLAPTFTFLVLLMLLVSLVATPMVFSGKKFAPLIAMALSTVVLLIGSTVLSDGAGAADKFYSRIIQIFMVTLYVVAAFSLAQLVNDKLRFRNK